MKSLIAILMLSAFAGIYSIEKKKTDRDNFEKDGMQLYLNNCVTCHGWDGKGAFCGVPDFTKSYSPLKKPIDVLLGNVVEGSANGFISMPPRGGNRRLTDDDIRKILKFMKKQMLK